MYVHTVTEIVRSHTSHLHLVQDFAYNLLDGLKGAALDTQPEELWKVVRMDPLKDPPKDRKNNPKTNIAEDIAKDFGPKCSYVGNGSS